MLATNHESPVHLIRNGQEKRARRSLHKLGYTESSAEKRYSSINGSFKRAKSTKNIFQKVLDPMVWKPFLIVTGKVIIEKSRGGRF